jgi:hypothetical protein
MNSGGQRLAPRGQCPLARILFAMTARTRVGHSRRANDVRQRRDFGPPNLHVRRRFDPDANRLTANPEDRDLDVVADLKLLVRLPRKNQHDTHSFA